MWMLLCHSFKQKGLFKSYLGPNHDRVSGASESIHILIHVDGGSGAGRSAPGPTSSRQEIDRTLDVSAYQ